MGTNPKTKIKLIYDETMGDDYYDSQLGMM